MNEVAPMEAVQDKIKNRIRAEFAALIPDEMWAQMVNAVVRDFTTDRPDRYNNGVQPSPLKAMIRAEIEELCKAQIAEELKKHAGSWDGYGQRIAAEATQQMIRDHAPAMLAAMQHGMTAMMVQSAIQSLRNSIGQY